MGNGRELADSAVRWTILRPSGIYGPGRAATVALFESVARRRVWLHGPARVVVHPTYVTDLVAAIQLVLERTDLAGEVFNVAGERALPFSELIAEIGERMGRAPMQLGAPQWVARLGGAASRVWQGTGHRPPAVLARLTRSVVDRSVDTAKARSVLGFTPVPLATGLDETARALRSE